jgi:hypothetical protein
MADERPDYGQENLILAGRCLVIAGVLNLVGALVAWFTGDEVSSTQYDSFRSHMDAVLVLGTLGVAFVAGAILVHDEVVSRRRQRHVGRSHYE